MKNILVLHQHIDISQCVLHEPDTDNSENAGLVPLVSYGAFLQ